MANIFGMDLGQRAHHLPGVDFDENDGEMLFVFGLVACDARYCIGYKLSYCIEVEFILLFTFGLECMFELDDVWVVQFTQDLQLSILVSFILIYFFDCHNLPCFFNIRFKYYTECTLTYNFFC